LRQILFSVAADRQTGLAGEHIVSRKNAILVPACVEQSPPASRTDRKILNVVI
jgi:hypothetical protein